MKNTSKCIIYRKLSFDSLKRKFSAFLFYSSIFIIFTGQVSGMTEGEIWFPLLSNISATKQNFWLPSPTCSSLSLPILVGVITRQTVVCTSCLGVIPDSSSSDQPSSGPVAFRLLFMYLHLQCCSPSLSHITRLDFCQYLPCHLAFLPFYNPLSRQWPKQSFKAINQNILFSYLKSLMASHLIKI